MKTDPKHLRIQNSSTVICACAALLFLGFTLTARATGTVVQNGGFETGSFSSWSLTGNTGNCLVSSGSNYVHSGTYGAALGPVGSLGYLSQTLTTVPGQIYRLSFWLYSPGGSTTEFNVVWNGSTLMDLNNPPAAGWSNYVFTVTAASSSTALQFGFRNDPSFFGLDDISVTPVGVGLTFDDLGNFVNVPNGYGGLNWNYFQTLDAVNYTLNPSGYEAGMVSASNVLWNTSSPASITNANPFNLYSAYLTAAWNDNLQVEVQGYSSGTLIYDNTYTLSATNRMLINFNYLDVTEVDFYASGGTPHPGYSGSGTLFAMDNVNVTTGPGVQSNPQIAVPLPGPLLGQSAYVRSSSAGEPWGRTDNIWAMNRVFGSNDWQSLYYETVNPAALFSPAMHCVFLEGSDANATALANFLSANLSAMQTWVSNGGSLFVNAAPTEGGNINFGFGVTLNFNTDYSDASSYAVAVNPLNPIFNGPFLPVGTNWSGDFFAHATVSGAGLIPMIVNSNITSAIILGEMQAGLGHVLFGGMTIPYYHSPQPQGSNLLANVLAYMDNCPQITFDDLPPTTGGLTITNGYRGFNWNNFDVVDGVHYTYASGYQAGVISTNNLAFGLSGVTASITAAQPFNFVSAWLTAAWRDNLQVEVRGYVHGILAYDQTYTLSATAPTLIVFNYLDVTEVDFIASGGTPHPGYDYSAPIFAMDNVTVAPAPEPLLTIVPSGSTAIISWSAPATGWSLQQEPSLTGAWASPTNIVNDGGTNKFIIVNPSSGSEFYRLVFQ
jgi:hypothetical protein